MSKVYDKSLQQKVDALLQSKAISQNQLAQVIG